MFCSYCGNPITAPAAACVTCGKPTGMKPAGSEDIGQNAGMRMLLPVGRSAHAIAAGYLGLLSPLLLPAPLAIFFAILAIRDIRKNPRLHGMGRAVFGLVAGVLGTLFLLYLTLGILIAR